MILNEKQFTKSPNTKYQKQEDDMETELQEVSRLNYIFGLIFKQNNLHSYIYPYPQLLYQYQRFQNFYS